jgi:hypothetical protein
MPWNRVLRFTDPLPCQAAVQAADVQILPTKSGDFQVEMTQIGMNRLWMQRFHELAKNRLDKPAALAVIA